MSSVPTDWRDLFASDEWAEAHPEVYRVRDWHALAVIDAVAGYRPPPDRPPRQGFLRWDGD